MRRGPEQGKVFPLVGDLVTLGRGHKNDIIIDDNDVSREHLRFKQVSGGYELQDLTSTNGTFINGQLVEGVWLLRSHCIIELGDTITLEYRMGDPTHDSLDSNGDFPAQQDFYLIVTTEVNKEPVIYPLRGDVISVGRSTSNDIVIVEPELSRQHFRLTRSKYGYTIQDLGSTNGTIVNGEAVTDKPHQLYNTDLITIGTSISIHVTNDPDKYTSKIKTDQLVERGKPDSTHKRKTSQAEVAGVAPMLKGTPEPTEIGTGVEHKSLEDQVLISYARADWEKVVAPLVNSLFSAGIETWVDQYLPEGSGDWLIATEQSRLECWMLLVVVSPAAMKSDLVKKNWRHFHNREKPIILLIHEPVEKLPIGSKALPRIQYNPGVPDIAFQQVIAEVKKLRPT